MTKIKGEEGDLDIEKYVDLSFQKIYSILQKNRFQGTVKHLILFALSKASLGITWCELGKELTIYEK